MKKRKVILTVIIAICVMLCAVCFVACGSSETTPSSGKPDTSIGGGDSTGDNQEGGNAGDNTDPNGGNQGENTGDNNDPSGGNQDGNTGDNTDPSGGNQGGNTGEDNPTHEHSYATTIVTPTCVEQGYTLHTCACGDSYKDNYTDATGLHTYTTYVYNNDATCVDDGTETAECDVCHEAQNTRTKANTATGLHTYTTYVYNNDATCLADGTETAVCDVCHEAQNTRTKSNTATGEHEYQGYTCKVCGEYSPDAPLTQGLRYTEIKENDEVVAYSVSGKGTATETEIYIPSTYNGLPVTSIGYRAFYYCSSLESIEIPNSVTSIGEGAFYYCRSLTSIEIPNSVTSIGDDAFYNCSSITSIEIPDSVTSIGDYAFYYCSNLTTITYTGDIKGWCEISGLKNLMLYGSSNKMLIIDGKEVSGELVIPNSVTSIGGGAFRYCRSLTSIEIPNSVTSIGDYAFYNCSSLTSIEIPNSVTSIGRGAFYYCYSLTIYCEATSKPSGWNSNWNRSNCPVVWDHKNDDKDENGYAYAVIGGIRYSLKDGIATVVVQPMIISGDIVIFASVTYKNETYSVTSIGDGVFYNCSSITSIEIPDSVTSIGDGAFYYCYSLTIYCEATSKPSGWNSNWNNSKCPVIWNCKNNDKDTEGYAYAIIDGIRYRLKGGIAMIVRQPSNITSAVIPASVTYKNETYNVTGIFYESFSSCSSLTSVVIGNGVTSIGFSAFEDCSSLTSVVIGNSVMSIGNNVFQNCSSLTSIIVQSGNTKYHSDGNCLIETASKTLIAGCKTSVIPIDGSVTSIGGGAFYGCSSLTSIEIPNTVTSIASRAFEGCSSLTSIEIPNTVTSIGGSAFSGCDSLQYNEYDNGLYLGNSKNPYVVLVKAKSNVITTCTIHANTKVIYCYAFYYCSSLTSIGIPNSVTSIGGRAFQSCSSLTSIEIPNSVTSIGDYAFTDCSSLTIYCEAESKPSGWESSWNYSSGHVVWGYKG